MKFLSKIAFAFLSIYLSGCSTTQYYKIKDSSDFRSDQEIKLPKYSEKKRQAGKITLLPHQYYPIDYLLKHPKQKGLLINHYLGTGKTFLGLGFAEKMLAKNNGLNNHKIILIVPRFLKSNWVTQMRQFGVKDKSKYERHGCRDCRV